MIDIREHGGSFVGGGGGGGFVKLTIHPTAPNNPKENDIWVKYHDTKYSKILVQNEQPSPEEDAVWINTLQTLSTIGYRQVVDISRTKDVSMESLIIYIRLAKEGKWLFPSSYCFKNGKWEFISGIDYVLANDLQDFYFTATNRDLYYFNEGVTTKLMDDTSTHWYGGSTVKGMYTKHNGIVSIASVDKTTTSSTPPIAYYDTIAKKVNWSITNGFYANEPGFARPFDVPNSDNILILTNYGGDNDGIKFYLGDSTTITDILSEHSRGVFQNAILDNGVDLYVITRGTIIKYKLDLTTKTLTKILEKSAGTTVNSVHRLSDGRIYIFTTTGIFEIDKVTLVTTKVNDFNSSAITYSIIDKDDCVWYADSTNLYRFDLKTFSPIFTLPQSYSITSLYIFGAVSSRNVLHVISNSGQYIKIDGNGTVIETTPVVSAGNYRVMIWKEPDIQTYPEYYFN